MTQLESSLDSRLGRIEAALFKLSNDHVASPTTGQGDAIFSWDEQLTGGDTREDENRERAAVCVCARERGCKEKKPETKRYGNQGEKGANGETTPTSPLARPLAPLPSPCASLSISLSLLVFQAPCPLPLASSRMACTA